MLMRGMNLLPVLLRHGALGKTEIENRAGIKLTDLASSSHPGARCGARQRPQTLQPNDAAGYECRSPSEDHEAEQLGLPVMEKACQAIFPVTCSG